jgi:hypothetical protein
MTDTQSETIDAIKERSVDLANDEYAARCSALLIALNRELARCAAAFGEVHQIDPAEIMTLVAEQFSKNHVHALNALRGEGSSVQ